MTPEIRLARDRADRKHTDRYRHLRPSSRPHETCKDCPHLGQCPLKMHISPCVFKTIAINRREV